MHTERFAAISLSVSAVLSRRGALRGLAASLGLVALRPAASGAKKKRKKKAKGEPCDRCPRRSCCECTGISGSGSCGYVATQAECEAFCEGAIGGEELVTGPPGFTALCTTDNACVVVECPVV